MASRKLSAVAVAAQSIRAELRARQVAGSALSGATISVTSEHASLCSTVRVRVDRTATSEDTRAMARDVWAVVNQHWQGNSAHFTNVIVNGQYLGEFC